MADSSELAARYCQPCKSGTPPLTDHAISELIPGLHAEWSVLGDGTSILRTFKFTDYRQTIAFVNAIAELAEQEGHHPDLTVSYGKVGVLYTTHATGGLSENDFICAAKIDRL